MRNDPDKSRQVTSSDLFARLEAGPAVQMSLQEQADRPLVSPRVVSALVRLGEGLLVLAMGTVIWLGYRGAGALELAPVYLPILAAVALGTPALFHLGGLYTIHALMRVYDQLSRLAISWMAIFACVFALLFFSKAGDSYSRVWLASWFIGGFAAIFLFRLAVRTVVLHWNAGGQLDRRAVLVGGGQPAQSLIDALASSKPSDIRLTGVFDDRSDERSPPVIGGLRKLGTIGELIDFVRRSRTDILLVTFPITAETRLLEILKKLWVLPVDIRLSAHTQKLRYRPRAYSYIGNVPFLDLSDKPLTDWDQFLKTAEDKIVAGLLLLLLSPLMLLIALAVKLESRGPVFFTQRRFGFNNELIQVYKFESMYVDHADAQAAKLVSRNDPRVTRVGRFIRKTSLDDPQILNVLKGDLSLVGPRPHPEKAKAADRLYNEVVEGYFARHKVKPGITGWAQVNGWRGETDTAEKIQRRVEHDLYYIENWSLFLDLSILLRTPLAIFDTENAY